jgi:5-oxoprolinase (ATP-hydrolysing)
LLIKPLRRYAAPGQYPGSEPSRRIADNLSDLKAQCAACAVGAQQVQILFEEYGKDVVQFYMTSIRKNAEVAVRKFFKQIATENGGKPLYAMDHMDDGTPIALTITINPEDGAATFDFEGTGCEGYSNLVRSLLFFLSLSEILLRALTQHSR